MRKLLGVLVLALLLYRPAHAEMTAQEYLREPATAQHAVNAVWLSGIALGMDLVNNYLVNEGSPRITCTPQHVALTHDQIVSILDEYLKSDEGRANVNDPVAVVLLFAMKRAFPCPPK